MKKLLVILFNLNPFIYMNGIEELDAEIFVFFSMSNNPDMQDINKRWMAKTRAKVFIVDSFDDLYNRAFEVGSKERISGILYFNEFLMVPASKLAERLGVPFHSKETVQKAQSKYYQREALKKAGVGIPKYFLVKSEDDLEEAIQYIGFPAVLKPISGAGSYHVYNIENKEDLYKKYNSMILSYESLLIPNENKLFLLEEKLIGVLVHDDNRYGDYVSVESLVYKGEVNHICLSDKTPLVAPFRESGSMLPSVLPDSIQKKVNEEVTAAIHAVGIENGAVHTEVKFTSQGPKIIEVNARIGGYKPLMFQICSDFDMAKEAAKIALGEAPQTDIKFHGYSASFFFHAELEELLMVEAIEGWEEARQVVGVHTLIQEKKEGDIIDTTVGTASLYGSVSTYSNTSAEAFDVRDKVKNLIKFSLRNPNMVEINKEPIS